VGAIGIISPHRNTGGQSQPADWSGGKRQQTQTDTEDGEANAFPKPLRATASCLALISAAGTPSITPKAYWACSTTTGSSQTFLGLSTRSLRVASMFCLIPLSSAVPLMMPSSIFCKSPSVMAAYVLDFSRNSSLGKARMGNFLVESWRLVTKSFSTSCREVKYGDGFCS